MSHVNVKCSSKKCNVMCKDGEVPEFVWPDGTKVKKNTYICKKGANWVPRTVIIAGYPNVGKSALINRLVGQRKVKSENRPGVTRGFSWIRIDSDVRAHPLASRGPPLAALAHRTHTQRLLRARSVVVAVRAGAAARLAGHHPC